MLQGSLKIGGSSFNVTVGGTPTTSFSASTSYSPSSPLVHALVHFSDIGDRHFPDSRYASEMNKSVEGFSLRLTGPSGLGIEYMVCMTGYGDSHWASNGEFVGTRGQSRPIEGFYVRLTGPLSTSYEVKYLANVDFRELPPVSSGGFCGIRGRPVQGLRVWVESKMPAGCSPGTVIFTPGTPTGPIPVGTPVYPGMGTPVYPPTPMGPNGPMPVYPPSMPVYPGMGSPVYPGSMPPGSFPPGSFPPGSFPPGSFPPGSFPPGSVPIGSMPPGSIPPPERIEVYGTVHIQDVGDQTFSRSEFAGTRGRGKRMEGFMLDLSSKQGISIEYMAILDSGESHWFSSGTFVGSRGQSRKLYGFGVRLQGPLSYRYDVKYIGHISNLGDTTVYSNGAICGSRGGGQLDGFRVWLEPRF